MEHRNQVEFEVTGAYGLFSDPVMRVGGEKCSLQVPTYEALKGILASVYWKPTLIWYIDAVRVMNPIRMQTKGVKPILYAHGPNAAANTLSYYTYLYKVRYQVEAHFEWNPNMPDLAPDRNEDKHFQIAQRMIKRGGRRDIFLGTRECQGYVEPCTFGEGRGAYDQTPELGFGMMYHGLNYPSDTGREKLELRLWRPVMAYGIINFMLPYQCTEVRELCDWEKESFMLRRNCQPVEELCREAIQA